MYDDYLVIAITGNVIDNLRGDWGDNVGYFSTW